MLLFSTVIFGLDPDPIDKAQIEIKIFIFYLDLDFEFVRYGSDQEQVFFFEATDLVESRLFCFRCVHKITRQKIRVLYFL